MFRNYWKVALRNLRRQLGYSIINIFGLGIGLTCAFMIVLFVRYETGYDAFHERADRLYRVLTEGVKGDNAGERQAVVPAGFARDMKDRYPEIEAAILYDDRTPYLRVDDQSTRVGSAAFMSPEALQVFSFPLVRGNPETALTEPYSVLLTEAAARTLFGDDDPMGRQITYTTSDGGFNVTVTGILQSIPSRSHLQFEALMPISIMKELMGENALEDYTNVNYYLYLLLKPGSTAEALEVKLKDYQKERMGGNAEQIGAWRYVLQPISDIHLTTDVDWDVNGNVDPMYLVLLSGIALLILVVASANFINLATARATKRAREVGMRKAVGAQRRQLITQFMGESVMLGLISIVVAIILTMLFLPAFRQIIGSTVSFRMVDVRSLAVLVAIGLSAGILAGIYPALYVSAFRPSAVLKGEFNAGSGASLLRKGLLVFQFCISIFLIVSTITVYRQLEYVRSKQLGFDKSQVVYAPLVSGISSSYDGFRQTLLQDSRIRQISQAGNMPGRVNTSRGYNWPGQLPNEEEGESFYTVLADYDYLETVGLELIAGRDFSRDRGTDFEDAYILNESAVSKLGYASPEEAVGGPFRAWDKEMGEIIGVVRDFHFQSLHQEIGPVVINIKPWIGYVAFRLEPGDHTSAISRISEEWARVAPGAPFDYRFLDEDFDRLYRADQDLGRLFTFFATLAIVVACLGLFGLSAYSAERRRKEMSIRKVLGASAPAVVGLLSAEFLKLVIAGFIVAAPLAWYAMNDWLNEFAYSIELGPAPFLLAGIATLMVAEATVFYQAIRAAFVDPAKALRAE